MTAPRFIQRHPRIRARGFALVTTLIMVTLAAVIVVALLVNASLERTTATSYANRFSAELAVQNGLEAAKQALMGSPTAATSVTNDDTFLVLRADGTHTNPTTGVADAYYFLAKAQPGNANQVDCYPLFAGGTPTVLAIDLTKTPAVAAPTPPPSPLPSPAQETFGSTTKQYPTLLPFQQPAYTGWQEVRDPNDTAAAPAHNLPYQRYTFWVEDLGGYIDASVAGNTAGSGGGNQRPLDQSSAAKRYITSPAELAIFTIFNPSAPADPGDTDAKTLINNRALLFTQGTLKQLAPGAGSTDVTSPTLATRLGRDMEVPLVPLGYGYADEGNPAKPKLDINAQVTIGGANAVQAIASQINNNLPTFGSQRKGGLAGLDYVNTIAASIIDYADTDSNATIGPDYRGYDSYPLVSEIYTVKNWTKVDQTPATTGNYFATVTMDTWVELWNMSNQSITGKVSFTFKENHPLHVGQNTYTLSTDPSALPGSTVTTTYPSGQSLSVSMQPNEYKVFLVQSDVFHLDSGYSPPIIWPQPGASPKPTLPLDANANGISKITPSTPGSTYEMTWKDSASQGSGAVVDKSSLYGIFRDSGNLSGPTSASSNRNWRGSLPGFIGNSPQGGSTYYDTIGDPRLAYYWGCPQAPNSYTTQSSMWGRNIRLGISGNPTPNYKEVKPSLWPDRGHESATVAASAGTATHDPPATSPVATETTKAPAMISNSGRYETIAEFGNIYDPGQWNITPDANSRWSDITTPGSADANYGGGMTLRIGRPEFSLFDKPGLRAWQLLDLFQPAAKVDTRGLININTASRDALRALGAGVLLNRDSNLVPSSSALYPPYKSSQADVFADAVIAARPFLSPAQLSGIPVAGTSVPLFGNPAAWSGTSQTGPTEWDDSGTEEYFAKVFPSAAVRSRNFRVFVTGQNLDQHGNVSSTVSRAFQVYINPVRNSSGAITQQNAITTYETLLP